MIEIIMGAVGALFMLLLAIIAFFLRRLLGQFDDLRSELTKLNSTMLKIDRDMSTEIGIVKSKVGDLDTVWERIRNAENDLIALKSGGCKYAEACKYDHG